MNCFCHLADMVQISTSVAVCSICSGSTELAPHWAELVFREQD